MTLRADESFHVKIPGTNAAADADPLESLFPNPHVVPLAQILETVSGHCDMLSICVCISSVRRASHQAPNDRFPR
ncbi:MAG: hypothetical protein OXC53_12715 [Rhodobacteraceae bacterium]|nr:hypothetical protein [Paracoccaceae bacterium]